MEGNFNNFIRKNQKRKGRSSLMNKKYTAEELFNAVKNMENGERLKFLEIMYDEYYNTDHLAPEGTKKEHLRLETAFLRNKINEIEKEIEELKKKK
jgi:hypothetical protein